MKRGNLEKILGDWCDELKDEDEEVEDSVSADDNESRDVSEPDLSSSGGPVDFMSPKNLVANCTASGMRNAGESHHCSLRTVEDISICLDD